MMRVVMVCNTDGALYNFRGPLIEALVLSGCSVHTISQEAEYFGRLRALGAVPHAEEFARHSTNPLRDLSLLYRLRRHLIDLRPDVVHSFTHKAAIYGTLAARLLGISRVFVTITGLGTVFVRNDWKAVFVRTLLLLQYRISLRFAKKVYFQNPDDLDLFVSRGVVCRNKVELTAGSGLDLRGFPRALISEAPHARAEIASILNRNLEGLDLVVFPARAVAEKGLREFYQAAKLINNSHPGRYEFVHIGSVEESLTGVGAAEELRRLADDCGVRYMGFREDPERFLLAADMVVLPSYREGTPRSLIEALALGKWVITSDAPGCREVVIPEITGKLCKPRCAESLVDAILSSKATAIAAAKVHSRKFCEDKFNVEKLVVSTLREYGVKGYASPFASEAGEVG